uniref:Cytosolic 5'-nucleotidase 1A n=1 Tax=Dicentrarchus labrax TaxID=13489 RepID=A0A8P4K1W6_DICLA
MSLNNGQTLTVREQDLTGNSSSSSSNQAAWEDARVFLKPSTPTRKPKPPKPENAITIAVSSRVLFNMEKEQHIYEQQGMEEYIKYQVEHEMQPFSPGPAFSFVKALEAVNTRLRELYPDSEELFDVVLMTNNHAYVGLRLINTINHHQLFIERFCMTGGNSPIGYLKAYHTNLYLSADPAKVREALEEGIAAATMFTPEKITEVSETQLRVAFDGDAVLFSDESERIYKAHGLDKFFEHEKAHENKPLDHVQYNHSDNYQYHTAIGNVVHEKGVVVGYNLLLFFVFLTMISSIYDKIVPTKGISEIGKYGDIRRAVNKHHLFVMSPHFHISVIIRPMMANIIIFIVKQQIETVG